MQKLIVLYNPNALKGKIEKFMPHIVSRLKTKFDTVDTARSNSGAHMVQLARLASSKYDFIVVCGGDGSIHNVVNGIKLSGENVTLGILPYGTVNDVCSTLHIKKKLDKAIDVILRGKTLKYDIMKTEKDYIIYTLSGGMFVSSSFQTKAKSKRIFGKLAYFFNGIGQLFRLKSFPMTYVADGQRIDGKYLLALILNTYSTAGFYINGKSSVSDGKMELVLIEKRKSYFMSLLTMARLFLFGVESVKKKKGVTFVSATDIKIENHSQVSFTADGEESKFLKRHIVMDKPINIFHGIDL